ncbi:MAG: hypothetical protein ACOYYJ_02825 [Chloroflexota bacterium]
MDIFRQRLPARQDMFAVLGAAAFVVFSWSIRGFLFVFPSRVMYFRAWELFSIFMYMMAVALVESLMVAGGLIALGMALPPKWLREGFSYKGFLTILVATAAAIFFQRSLGNDLPPKEALLLWMAAPVILLLGLLALPRFFPRLGLFLTSLAERFTVFAYLYLPLGFLGLLVVLLRNAFPL